MAATKTIVRYRAPKAKRHHKRAAMTIPLGVLAGFAPTALFALEGFKGADGMSGLQGAAYHLTGRLTGYNLKTGQFYWNELAKGWGPILLGMGIHKLAGRFGVNRAIARAGIPLFRI
jgi:hypothetical protein